MPTVAVILDLAPAACVLAANDIDKGALFGQRLDPDLAIKIYATYIVIKKVYDYDPTFEGIVQASYYLWELMGRYGIAAAAYSGGGSVTPATPTDFVYLIPITGADFIDATNYDDIRLIGKSIVVFFNDINRYLISNEFSLVGSNLEILIPGFDATLNPSYELIIYIINP